MEIHYVYKKISLFCFDFCHGRDGRLCGEGDAAVKVKVSDLDIDIF